MCFVNTKCREGELPTRRVALSCMSAHYHYIFPVLDASCIKPQILSPVLITCMAFESKGKCDCQNHRKGIRDKLKWDFTSRSELFLSTHSHLCKPMLFKEQPKAF